jgi:hypothetical protein
MTNAIAPKTTDQRVSNVIAHVLDGDPLKAALKKTGISQTYFHELLTKDRAAALAYARAVELRADNLADEALHIADTESDAAKARNQIQVRQWLASKLYAKRYGDRIDLNVTQTIDIGSTLAEARARLLPMRDQQTIIDVESRAVTGLAGHRAADNELPDQAAPDATPDIFT